MPAPRLPVSDGIERRRRIALLAAILAVALALRVFRLGWGLPEFFFFDDMFYFVRPAMALVRRGVIAPTQFVHTPVLTWLIAAAFWPWTRLTAGGVPPADPILADVIALNWIGRTITAVLSAATVLAVYLLARRLLGPDPTPRAGLGIDPAAGAASARARDRGALIAAALFAFAPGHLLETHRVCADAPMLLLAVLAMHQALRARDRGSVAALLGSFALAGLAAGVKYTGLASITGPIWVALTWHEVAEPESPPASGRRRLGLAALGGMVALLAFAVCLAPALLAWSDLVAAFQTLFTHGFLGSRRGVDLAGTGWWYARYVYELVAALPYMVGWPVYLTGLAGLVVLARTNRRALAAIAAAAGPLFLLQGAAQAVEVRYFLPLAPYLAIAAAAALAALWSRSGRLGAAVAVLIVASAGVLAASHVLRIGLGPQRRVGEVLARLASEASARGDRPVIAYPLELWLKWDAVAPELRRGDVDVVWLPKGGLTPGLTRAQVQDLYRPWIEREGVDAIVFPSQIADVYRREGSSEAEAQLLESLRAGWLGFRSSGRLRTPFVTESLYLWADPMLDTVLPAGITGYEVFVRAG